MKGHWFLVFQPQVYSGLSPSPRDELFFASPFCVGLVEYTTYEFGPSHTLVRLWFNRRRSEASVVRALRAAMWTRCRKVLRPGGYLYFQSRDLALYAARAHCVDPLSAQAHADPAHLGRIAGIPSRTRSFDRI